VLEITVEALGLVSVSKNAMEVLGPVSRLEIALEAVGPLSTLETIVFAMEMQHCNDQVRNGWTQVEGGPAIINQQDTSKLLFKRIEN
jgi:hypothetical protein